jgi:hypothetical protein
MERVVFTSLEFRNFKAFTHFSLALRDVNILVGPNNCGKSTVISAFRVLGSGLRRANARNPELVPAPRGSEYGYPVFTDDLPVSLENAQTDYSEKRQLFGSIYRIGISSFSIFLTTEVVICLLKHLEDPQIQ